MFSKNKTKNNYIKCNEKILYTIKINEKYRNLIENILKNTDLDNDMLLNNICNLSKIYLYTYLNLSKESNEKRINNFNVCLWSIYNSINSIISSKNITKSSELLTKKTKSHGHHGEFRIIVGNKTKGLKKKSDNELYSLDARGIFFLEYVMLKIIGNLEKRAIDIFGYNPIPQVHYFHLLEDKKLSYEMNRIEGNSLKNYFKSNSFKMLNPEQKLIKLKEILSKTANILEFYQKYLSFTHFDLHTGNIMIYEKENKIKIYLIDLGSSLILDENYILSVKTKYLNFYKNIEQLKESLKSVDLSLLCLTIINKLAKEVDEKCVEFLVNYIFGKNIYNKIIDFFVKKNNKFINKNIFISSIIYTLLFFSITDNTKIIQIRNKKSNNSKKIKNKLQYKNPDYLIYSQYKLNEIFRKKNNSSQNNFLKVISEVYKSRLNNNNSCKFLIVLPYVEYALKNLFFRENFFNLVNIFLNKIKVIENNYDKTSFWKKFYPSEFIKNTKNINNDKNDNHLPWEVLLNFQKDGSERRQLKNHIFSKIKSLKKYKKPKIIKKN